MAVHKLGTQSLPTVWYLAECRYPPAGQRTQILFFFRWGRQRREQRMNVQLRRKVLPKGCAMRQALVLSDPSDREERKNNMFVLRPRSLCWTMPQRAIRRPTSIRTGDVFADSGSVAAPTVSRTASPPLALLAKLDRAVASAPEARDPERQEPAGQHRVAYGRYLGHRIPQCRYSWPGGMVYWLPGTDPSLGCDSQAPVQLPD